MSNATNTKSTKSSVVVEIVWTEGRIDLSPGDNVQFPSIAAANKALEALNADEVSLVGGYCKVSFKLTHVPTGEAYAGRLDLNGSDYCIGGHVADFCRYMLTSPTADNDTQASCAQWLARVAG